MNRIRLLATGTILTFAVLAVAQQAITGASGIAKGARGGEHNGVPTVELHGDLSGATPPASQR